MLDVISNICTKSGYQNSTSSKECLFFEKDSKEFFLVAQYTVEDIRSFFTCQKTERLIRFFEEKKNASSNVLKNTSAIILLQVPDLKKDIEKLKNVIFQIEEDEYFFRKFVVVYTEKGVSLLRDKLLEHDDLERFIYENINDTTYFELFKENPFFDESYYLLMQLFTKLSFLTVTPRTTSLQNVQEIIDEKLEKQSLSLFNASLKNFQSKVLECPDNNDYDEDSYWVDLEGSIVSVSQENNLVDEFFRYFNSDQDETS